MVKMKKRYNQEQREEIVSKFKKSTEAKGVFAKTEGISVNTLNKWIEEVDAEIEEPKKFIKVAIPEIPNNIDTVKIRFGEFEIIVDENTSEELLWMVLRGVKTVC